MRVLHGWTAISQLETPKTMALFASSTRRRGGRRADAEARDEEKGAMISGAEQRIDKVVTKGRQMHVRKQTNV